MRKKGRVGIFGNNDSDSDEQSQTRMTSVQLVNKAIASQQLASKKQAEDARLRILAEDPSSLLYDAHYDQIQKERETLKEKSRERGKTRYISAIARASEARRIEQNIYKDEIRELRSKREGFNEDNTLSFLTDGYQKEKEAMERRKKEIEKEDEEYRKNQGTGFQAFRVKIFQERESEEPNKEELYKNEKGDLLQENQSEENEEDFSGRSPLEMREEEEGVENAMEKEEKESNGEPNEPRKEKGPGQNEGKVEKSERREGSRSRSKEKEKERGIERRKEISKEEKIRMAKERLLLRKKQG